MDALSMIGSVGITASFFFTTAALVIGYLFAPYWAVRKVPGPVPLPLIGHIYLLAKYGPDVFSILADRYGPIFRFHMGRQPLIIVASPELCREIGITKFKDFPNRSTPPPIAASPLHQKGLFFTKDKRWSTMRNTVMSFYQPSYLASLIPTMQTTIDSMMENFNPSKDEDITFSDMSLKLATDVIGKAAFGVDFGLTSQDPNPGLDNANTNSEFLKQHRYSTTQHKMDLSGSFSIIVGLLLPVLQEPFRQVLKRVPGTMDWKIDQTNRKLRQRVDEIVSKRTEERDHGSKDFLSLILSARASEKISSNIFSLDHVSGLTYEQLLAGSATASFTLSSVVYLVSGHPEVERKMLEEIDAFGPRTVSASDLQHKFPYMDQVIKEAMRFYLLSPLIMRETSRQVEIGSYTLPKGTWVWMALGVLAKDPQNFPEPEKFKPERFDPNCEEEKQRHPYAFIPFGIGPRSCIGEKFSLQETKLALINLYRKYVFRHAPSMEKPLELEFGIVRNFKHGVKVRAIKRNLVKPCKQGFSLGVEQSCYECYP